MAEPGPRTRCGRVVDVAAALLAGLLAFTAVPAVLILVVGDPLSGGLGHAWPPLPRALLCVLVVAAWVAWAACCAQLGRAVVARVRSGDVRAAPGSSMVDRLAVRIATGLLALSGIGTPVVLPAVAGANPPGRPAVAAVRAPRVSASHVVRPGDTLWGIADRRLDDAGAWTELAALNLGHAMGGSARFVDPDHLETGWRLRLPASAGEARAAGSDHRTGAKTDGSPAGGRLPELVALGLGSLTCAALARRARRRALPFTGDLRLDGPGSDEAVDTAALIGRFADVPALQAFETANCLLRSALPSDPPPPAVRAACVSPRGVTFFLAAPCASVPTGFTARQDGTAWHVSHDLLEEQGSCEPHVPVALPVGSDDEGSWLVCPGPGDVVPVLGEAAPALCRSLRAAATAWAWGDSVLAVEEPDDPRLRAELRVAPLAGRHLVFFGDPKALPTGAAARAAVVTTAAVAASGLSVLVDRHGATLHPMGRVVRPHLQSEATSRLLDELATQEDPARRDGAVVPAAADSTPDTARREDPTSDPLEPGAVEVRLLTMTPRLEGLREELPPNRVRRAVELVAYLALHRPDVVTSDRLRTRVLGSADADAASKTLFNTAHAARRAMGVDEHGDPLFPAGTRNGHYQVSPRVTVDAHRALSLARTGRDQEDPDAAVAFYRAALDLVEGEPLANALAGYSWWEAEGHGRRVAGVLVDAACSMAVLAAARGRFELARWGLERARLVEPYSEALSRAAMQLAAAEGDADRLRLEWRDCQRRVDALDPGSSPSPRTESLYGEHARLVAGGSVAAAGAAGGEGRGATPAAEAPAPAGS